MRTFFKENRLFTRLAGINLLSKVGDRLFYTAMLTLAASLPKGTLAVMIVSASETLPVLLSLFLGVMADKQGHKMRHLVGSSLFRAVMYLGIGLLFKYPPTLILLIMASLLNLLSDISGNYSTALFLPFTKALVAPENMEEAQGLVSLGSQLVTVLATFIGASLLAICNESYLAMINALVFLTAALLYWKIHPILKESERKIKTLQQGDTISTVKANFKSFLSDHLLFANLIQLAMLNGFFGGLAPIFALFIKRNNDLTILSQPLKLSILSGIITLFMIIGNSLTSKVFRKWSIFQINLLADIVIILVGISFIRNHLFLVFLANSLLAFFLGIVSPRFSADVVNRYPVERIGGIMTSVNALLVLAPPITSLLFPTLSNASMPFAYFGFIVYAVLFMITSLVIVRE